MAKMFGQMTEGAPLDGQGRCVYVAGTGVTQIKRVYIGTALNDGPQEWVAEVIAPGFRVGGTHGWQDKTEEPVAAAVPLAAIVER